MAWLGEQNPLLDTANWYSIFRLLRFRLKKWTVLQSGAGDLKAHRTDDEHETKK